MRKNLEVTELQDADFGEKRGASVVTQKAMEVDMAIDSKDMNLDLYIYIYNII